MKGCAIGVICNTPLSEKENITLTNRITDVISNPIYKKQIVLDFNEGLIDDFVKSNKQLSEKYNKPLYELQPNSLRYVIKEYKRATYPEVIDDAYASGSSDKRNFTSINARSAALRETSRLLVDEHNKLAFMQGSYRIYGNKNAEQIVARVKNQITTNLIARFAPFIEEHKGEEGFIKAEELYNKYKEANDKVKELKDKINSYKKQKTLTTEEQAKVKKLIEEYNTLAKSIMGYKTDTEIVKGYREQLRDIAIARFLNRPDAVVANKNYAAMAENIFDNTLSKNWFEEVYNLPQTFMIRSLFKDMFAPSSEANKSIGTIQEIDDTMELFDEEERSVDQNTSTWDDALYTNFLKHLDGTIMSYLSTIYKTNSTATTKENSLGNKKNDVQYDYATNAYLGTPEPMGIKFISSQLLAYGDFTSVEGFIASIEDMANNLPELSGLIKLANDMKATPSFANLVYSNFYKYAVKKSIIAYSDGNATIYQSNKQAFSGHYIFQKAISSAKITAKVGLSANQISGISEFQNRIAQIEKHPEYSSKVVADVANYVQGLFNHFYPGINVEPFLNWYWKDGGSLQKAKTTLSKFNNLINASNKFKEEYLRKQQIVNDYNKKVRNARQYDGILADCKEITLDYSSLDYRGIESSTKEIIKLYEEMLPSYNDYNSTNAENNNSSDLVKNSFITQFFRQLKDTVINKDGSVDKRGLENLKKFYTRHGKNKETLQHEFSTIIFGIPGIREGLFIERNGEYFVNPNADTLLDISLFNGIKNFDSLDGEMYQKMSSLDYFNTIVNYYFHPVNYNNENPNIDKYCQILFRIPSDASNQYALQMKKYSFDKFYEYDINAINSYVENKLLNPYLSLQGVDKSIVNIITELTDDLSKDLNEFVIKSKLKDYPNNILSANKAIQILNDGKLDVENLRGYRSFATKNTLVVPLVYLKDNQHFIIYCTTNTKEWNNVRTLTPISIQSLEQVAIKEDLLSLMVDAAPKYYVPIKTVFNTFVKENISDVSAAGFYAGQINRNYNTSSELYQAFVKNVQGEINNFFNGLTDLIETAEYNDNEIHYIIKKDTKGLFENYHYNPKQGIIKDGKLTGNVFKFNKLFNINDTNSNEKLLELLNIYGENGLLFINTNGDLEINQNHPLYNPVSKHITTIENIDFTSILNNWLNNYSRYIIDEASKYGLFGGTYNNDQIQEAFLNTTIAYYEMDDLFEGSAAYYKDAQTFLKRDKEVQAGGSMYGGGVDFVNGIGQKLTDLKTNDNIVKEIKISTASGSEIVIPTINYNSNTKQTEQGVLTARNGFRAITIKNVENVSERAQDIHDKLYNQLQLEGLSKEDAETIATNIAKGYGFKVGNDKPVKTTFDDAQSYITIEEFIRRKWMDGTISEYGDLLSKLLDENYEFTKEDYDNINKKIQVQKNFYYDLAFDEETGLIYPRQIKNAEFVLIPRFIKGTSLEQLYNIMKKHDINQVNTSETSKAANKNALEFWDNNGIAHSDILENSLADESVDTYYYNYLYKQQDFVDHIENEENKAGIQLLKKIIDNISDTKEQSDIVKAAKTIQNNLTKNIEASFNALLDKYGWSVDENGQINSDLDFTEFFEDAKREAARLGMDSNLIDYYSVNEQGKPIYPLVMNDKVSKLEAIAQSIFNHNIIRQTLPGFHAVQISDIGFDSKLRYIPRKEGENANNIESYVEIRVAPWNDDIKDLILEFGEEEALRQLQKIGADEIIGYRIPTEGKQSIAKMKVVGFLDNTQGSTMQVAKEWVTQTGSDFDIDTIYTITHTTHLVRHNDGTVELIMDGDRTLQNKKDSDKKYSDDDIFDFNQKQQQIKRNNEIVEAFKTILSSDYSFEENMSRSNFDDIKAAIEKYNKQFNSASVYNPFSQIQFMQNAIDGRKLKAFSVNRDTFNSISNKVHGIIRSGIYVDYSLDDISLDNAINAYGSENVKVIDNIVRVYHDKIGWSNNNRNILGRLLTPYSSQTTAHILDAIKSGTVFNETDYTFGSFKTLIDIGIDYDTAVSFLAQETITDLNNIYNRTNSIFSNEKSDVINEAYRNFISKFEIVLPNINGFSSAETIFNALSENKDFIDRYNKYWGLTKIGQIPAFNKNKFEQGIDNKIDDKDKDVYYFGILEMFRHLKEQADAIDNIVKISRPDATGVKQTIFGTLRFVDKVNEELNKKKDDVSLLTDKGENFVKALYVDKAYQYLAADFDFGIIPSIIINQQLFDTTSPAFYKKFKEFEKAIGRTLGEDEYKAFTKYAISTVYNQLTDIICPIKLDSHGNIQHITGDPKMTPNYWNDERLRIYGLKEAKNGDKFSVSSFTEPSPEELEEYYKLSPLQKVLFLQRTLVEGDNIFNKLYVSKTTNRVDKGKEFNYNTISINVDETTIESIYEEFNNAFFNKNPFIRAAALDLVKYAFVVEGFNFRKGNITKIITNDALYNARNYGGLDLAPTINNIIKSYSYLNDELVEDFVRSHSNLIRTINVKKPSNNKANPNEGDLFNSFRQYINVINNDGKEFKKDSGTLKIQYNPTTLDLYHKLKLESLNKFASVKYLRINSWNPNTNKYENVLYEAQPIKSTGKYVDGYILSPLNFLEEFEHGDTSINNDNNIYYIKEFYQVLNTEIVYNINDLSKYIANKFTKESTDLDKIDIIEETLQEENSPKRNVANSLKHQVLDWLLNDRTMLEGGSERGIVQCANFKQDLLGITYTTNPDGTTSVIPGRRRLMIDADSYATVEFVPMEHKDEEQLKNLHNLYISGKSFKATPYYRSVVENNNLYWTNNKDEHTFFEVRVARISDETDVVKESDNIEENNNNTEEYSAFDGVFDDVFGKPETTINANDVNLFNVSNLIVRELQYSANNGNERVKEQIKTLSLKGFVFGDDKSLYDYQTDIYKYAAEFYKSKSLELIDRMKHFAVGEKTFNISDENLYKELKNYPEKAYELYRLLLEASNFGKRLGEVDKLSLEGDTKSVEYIKSIQNSIKEVVSNPGLKTAFDFVYNIYIAENFSNNPNVKIGIIELTDVFGDSDWFDTNIGDVTNINHKQVQVVTKMAMTELHKARIQATKDLSDFNRRWNEIKAIIGEDNMQTSLNKIIDDNGKFVQRYDNKFIEKKEEIDNKVFDAAKTYGVNSLEWLKAKQEQRKWYYNNVVQAVDKQYYKSLIDITDKVLNSYGKYLSDYLKLRAKYKAYGPYNTLTQKEKDERKALGDKLADMTTPIYDDSGFVVLNPPAEAVRTYNREIAKLQKEYFERITSDDFIALINTHKSILEAYKTKYAPLSVYDMYNNPDSKFDNLRESYDWLKYNTEYRFNDDTYKLVQEKFEILGTTRDKLKRNIAELINTIPKEERTDVQGHTIGTKYSLETAHKIKEETIKKYYGFEVLNDKIVLDSNNVDRYGMDTGLIKVVEKTPVLTRQFYESFYGNKPEVSPDQVTARNKLYTNINNILKKGLDSRGIISIELLAQNCTLDELKTLVNSYNALRALNSVNKNSYFNQDDDTKARPYKLVINEAALHEQELYLDNIPNEFKFYIERILYATDKDGITLKKDETGNYVGNNYLYGYIKLDTDKDGNYTDEAKEYIDFKKTEARDFLDNNIEFAPTEYFVQAQKEAQAKGDEYYKKWKDANIVYNPYTHKEEPICIWTTMRPKSTGSLTKDMEYFPTIENTTSKIKQNKRNKEYKNKLDVTDNSAYFNDTYKNLTEAEQNLRALLIEYAQKFAINDFQKQFLKENYAPRLADKETTWDKALNDVANAVGLGMRNYSGMDWHSRISFNEDFDAKFNMYTLIKDKATKSIPQKPARTSFIDDAAYEKAVEDWKALKKQIEEHNKDVDKHLFSKDWYNVYKELINTGNEYLAKDKVKDLLYLTLEDLRTREALDISTRFGLKGGLVRNRRTSTTDTQNYRTVAQTNTAATFENWVRRFLFDEYKNYNPLKGFVDRIQSFTSARFMMFNPLSGANNVNVGVMNMIQEGIADDYFGFDDFVTASARYMSQIGGYVNHFFTDEVNNENEALMALFNVEGYDRINNPYKDYKSYLIEKANDIAYGFLSAGEHYMQNTAMFAMLKSHRLYPNPITGKWEVGTEKDYLNNIEIASLTETLKKLKNISGNNSIFYNDLLARFDDYLKSVRKDARKKLKFDRLQIDIVNDFIRSDIFNIDENKQVNTARKKEFIKHYLEVKQQLLNQAKEKFKTFETVESQLRYDKDEHREVIIDDSHLTEDHIAYITNRAISVNKKIHGVYDKLGAAKIESTTLGGIAMQYRKHLYPGFMKFWQRKGNWNEHRDSNEFGIFQSMLGLFTVDQRHGSGINNMFELDEIEYDDKFVKRFMKTFANNVKLALNSLIDIKYNWALLPDWQKRNISRVIGYLAGWALSLGMIMLIYAAFDDDDIKDNNWLGSLIFLMDRLNNESKQFTIRGLYSEFENFRNTPVVGYKVIQDIFKLLGYFKQWAMLGEDYNPNYTRGTYKGENKVAVTIRKNVPILNQYERFKHISKNNNFYKVGEDSTDQTLIKNIGTTIKNDAESRDDANAYSFIR